MLAGLPLRGLQPPERYYGGKQGTNRSNLLAKLISWNWAWPNIPGKSHGSKSWRASKYLIYPTWKWVGNNPKGKSKGKVNLGCGLDETTITGGSKALKDIFFSFLKEGIPKHRPGKDFYLSIDKDDPA